MIGFAVRGVKMAGKGMGLEVTGIKVDGAAGFGFSLDKTLGTGVIGFRV